MREKPRTNTTLKRNLDELLKRADDRPNANPVARAQILRNVRNHQQHLAQVASHRTVSFWRNAANHAFCIAVSAALVGFLIWKDSGPAEHRSTSSRSTISQTEEPRQLVADPTPVCNAAPPTLLGVYREVAASGVYLPRVEPDNAYDVGNLPGMPGMVLTCLINLKDGIVKELIQAIVRWARVGT